MHTNWNTGNTDLILGKTFFFDTGQILEQVAQRYGGISILGGGTFPLWAGGCSRWPPGAPSNLDYSMNLKATVNFLLTKLFSTPLHRPSFEIDIENIEQVLNSRIPD